LKSFIDIDIDTLTDYELVEPHHVEDFAHYYHMVCSSSVTVNVVNPTLNVDGRYVLKGVLNHVYTERKQYDVAFVWNNLYQT
jgi:hypothetical protein